MKYTLCEYQREAVDELVLNSEKLMLSNQNNKYMLLKAITGAGKTVMMAGYIEEMFNNYDDITFIWISVGDGGLHKQSKDSLEENLPDDIKVKLANNVLNDDCLRHKEILVLNWEALNDTKKNKETGEIYFNNVVMRGGERKCIQDIWRKTKENGTKIILIIDESHYTAASETSKLIIDMIAPEFIVEMTATPQKNRIPNKDDEINEKAFYVPVKTEKVIDEEIIKKSIKINDSLDENNTENAIDLILKQAIYKREELSIAYKDEDTDGVINPLCLIQLPDSDEGEEVKEIVLQVLSKYGIDDNKIAIWLTNKGKTQKVNIDELTVKDCPVEFLLFKKAVGTGWDCPRAAILVRFRDIKSVTFDLQTIGRILRMPERKYYSNDILNHGYIYTNSQYSLDTGDYRAVLPIRQVLQSQFRNEVLSMEFNVEKVESGDSAIDERALEGTFKNKMKKQNIDIDTSTLAFKTNTTSVDTSKFDNTSKSNIAIEVKQEKEVKLTTDDVTREYNKLIKSLSNKFYPEQSLNNTIKKYFKDIYSVNNSEIKKLVLLNRDIIKQCINEIKQEYKNTICTFINDRKFKFTEDRNTSEKETIEYRRCAYYKHFVSKYATETTFEEYLENLDGIKFWIKNSDNGEGVSLVYIYENVMHEFYPDYIVKFEDGTIGLYEVKDINDKEKETVTKVKIEKLKDYSLEHKYKCGLVEIKDKQVYKPTLPNELK
ncbi:DEAD/DEAH box helicase family protein [Clostridium perfringens]|nr:DEAD/DEAH box helicase family protein [Clostridium perfringens]